MVKRQTERRNEEKKKWEVGFHGVVMSKNRERKRKKRRHAKRKAIKPKSEKGKD